MTIDWVAAFGNRVKELRTARGWSQGTLAAKAGVSQSVIRDIENADRDYRPYDKTVQSVAKAFGSDGISLLREVGKDSMADYLEANQSDPLADLSPEEREVALRIIRDIVELGRRSHTQNG